MKSLKLLIIITAFTISAALSADGPITGFGALGNNLASGDWFTVVDISDTSASASGTNKKILTSDVGLYYISDTAYSSAFNTVTDKAVSKNALYDYLHLGDTDDDGKVDVIDSAVAGFPAFNASGVFVASRSLTAGDGLDITNPAGAAGDPLIDVDTTEFATETWFSGLISSHVWSFDMSGTDTAITFSSGIINVSTGTLQQGSVDVATISGTQVFTNKTLDASATGNVVKFKSLPQFTSPLLVDGTGCIIGTTSTTLGYGLGTFSNSADQAANYMEFRILVPQDWDTAVDPTIKLGIVLGGADTGTQRYVASVLDPASSASASGAPGTPINIDFAADASGASGDFETVAAVTLTGWGTIGTPGNLLIIRLARDGDAATVDTSTVNSIMLSAELAYGATQ